MMTLPGKSRQFLPWVLIALATAVVYQPAIQGGLIMDDAEHITPPGLQSFAGLVRIWFEVGATPHYYPFLNTAFWLEHRLWGGSPAGYHLVNLLEHAAAAGLVVLVVQRLRLPGALLAGLIFAIHPVHVESVAWISEQKNTLSTLFALGAALAYLNFEETRRGRDYALATGLFLLALLTKTVVAVVPPALLVVFWWQRGRLEWRRDVIPLLPWFGAGGVLGLFSAWFEQVHSHAQGAAFQISLLERTLIAGRAVWFYARTLVWPFDLMFINPRWTASAHDPVAYAGLAGIGLVGIALLVAARRWRGPLASYLLFVGMLFPVLGFLNINWFNFSYVADHFQYLPSLGLIVPFAAGAQQLITYAGRRLPWAHWVIPGVGLVVLGWAARSHCEDYRSPRQLYARTVEKNPECWLAHNNLGVLLLEEPEDLTQACWHFERALELKPDHARAHNNYGTALLRAGRVGEALVHYRQSLELQADVAEVHFNYGQALVAAGRPPEAAAAEFIQATRLKADYVDAHRALAELLAGLPDKTAEAVAAYRAALALAPGRADLHHGLAGVLAAEPGLRPEALAEYREAIRLNPAFAEACNNLGTLLADDAAARPEALQWLTRAVQLAPEYPDARFNLGVLLAGTPDRGEEATVQLRAAVRLKPDDPEARRFLADLLVRTPGGLPEAAAELAQVVRLQPQSVAAHLALARVLAQLPGQADAARDHYRIVLRLDPGNREARAALGAER